MKRRILLGLIISVAVVALLVIGGIYGMKYISTSHDKQIAELTIANVDLSKVADGTYAGSYKVFPVDVDVKVTIKDYQITDIELVKHTNGQGKPAEAILDQVIETQTLEVDIVAGATSSSKVILKAIENALNSGIK